MITKLANNIRALCVRGVNYWPTAKDCASMIDEALPVWTRITEDKSTWPEDGETVVMYQKENDMWLECWGAYSFKGDTGTYWRPLTDLDCPPDK